MSVKNALLERVNTAITGLGSVNFTVPSEAKKELADVVRKGAAGFGSVGETTPGWTAAKNLHEDLKAIQSRGFPNVDAFCQALQDFRDRAVNVFNDLVKGVEGLPDNVGQADSDTGTLGLRKKHFMIFTDANGQTVQLSAGDVAKGLINSKYLAMAAAPGASVANTIKAYLRDGCGYSWEEVKGNDSPFYTMYRHMRPALKVAIAKHNGVTIEKKLYGKAKEKAEAKAAAAAAAAAGVAPPVVANEDV
jgi:hypothetical protein